MNRQILLAAVPAVLCSSFLIDVPSWAQKQKAGGTSVSPEYYPMPSTGGTTLPFSESVKVGNTLLMTGATLPERAAAASKCAPADTAQKDIVGVMQDLFAAFRAHDLQRVQQITTPDFYAYDGGMRFTGPGLMGLLDQAQASGKHYEWSVTNPEVHLACNSAWISYVNQGAVEDSSGRQPVTWLESGILGYADGRWRIRFVHSTRAPKAP
jgi:ketosteroid isomerase-like protein